MDRLILVQRPTVPVISLIRAKEHLKVDTASDDQNITAMIAAATQYLDGDQGILGRALRPQTWQLLSPTFPIGYAGICLPLPPTISVDAVSYLGQDGVEVFLDETDYRIVPGGENFGASIYPTVGTSWPAVSPAIGVPDALRVIFTAGYLSVTSPEDDVLPAPIQEAVLMMLSSWYDKQSTQDVPELVGSLVASYRTSFLA